MMQSSHWGSRLGAADSAAAFGRGCVQLHAWLGGSL